ncbi:MAG: hypothetical protein COU31_01865 [Candidatus Magasanikbacteria bacterium CG10_big_fil_rev_8_21_14_0_10_40_10]|uniref:RNA polymerase sigma-70 region 4 domain-containing protein n=1 Tax=Candidatus Magasanikbacteria bacterium CG10_big_fil_rev_8_21_14_0_10_40_10 TaxID=1974648 RepID=A0A2M6W4F5_9BACT|nr:MAG: hypothetical protein COU31_01865 [Candidatus Magasanikbacteria bacterium CG10_big_fil_rev_8_21_14_0_10_40_10]
MFDFCRREEINSDIFFKLLNLKISPFSKQKTNRSVYRSDCHKIAKIFNKPIEELFNPNLYWRFVTDQVKENIIVHNKHNAKRGKGIIKLDRDYGEYEKNTIDRSVEVNGLFMRAFLKKYGHKRGNFTEFCQDVGVSLHALSRIKSFDSHAKYKIFKIKIGKIISYSETALKIAQVLETDPEQIFPARLYGFDDGGWDIEHDKRKISRGGADFEKMKDPEEILLEKEDVAVLKRILKESAKNDKEKEIFEMYYGLGAYDQEHTMEEIGEKFGVTREWVRQIITKMKKHLIKKIGVIDWNKKMKLKPMKIKK